MHDPSPSHRQLAAGVSSAAVFLAALDAYVVVTIFSNIMADLSIPIDRPERVTPVVTAYLLGYVAAMPLLGQLSDRIGRAKVIQACLAVFAVGSLVSAAAPSLPVLVAGRLLQGGAGGALLPVTFAVISDHWEQAHRPLPLGAVGAAQEMGSVIGPLYGAAIAVLVGWRGVFWVNLPLAAAAMVGVGRLLPGGGRREGVRVDFPGGLLLAAGLGAIIVGLYNPDPQRAALPSWGPLALITGAAGLIAFIAWERKAPARLLEFRGIHTRPFSAIAVCSFLSGVALMATLVDIPLFAQTLLGKDTLGGALILSRFLVALALGALAGGLIARRVPYRFLASAGLALAFAGYSLIARWPIEIQAARYQIAGVSFSRLDADLILAGSGLGLIIAPLAAAALRSSEPKQHGAVSAAVVVARMMGMLIGIAALGAFGTYRFQQLTSDLVPPLPFGMDPELFERRMGAYESAVRQALHTEYGEIFALTAAVCGGGAIIALGIDVKSGRADPGE